MSEYNFIHENFHTKRSVVKGTRERERDTERQRQRDKDRDRNRETEAQTDIQRQRLRDKQKDWEGVLTASVFFSNTSYMN